MLGFQRNSAEECFQGGISGWELARNTWNFPESGIKQRSFFWVGFQGGKRLRTNEVFQKVPSVIPQKLL